MEKALEVGATAPSFTAPLVSPGGEVRDTPLESLLERTPVILAFFSADFSPGCIKEWCEFRDYEWFATNDQVKVVGISKAKPATHKQFIKRLNLGFPFYAAPDLSIAETYGVKYRALKLLPSSRRACFLIDQEGVIRYRWLANAPIEPSIETPPVEELHRTVLNEFGDESSTVASPS